MSEPCTGSRCPMQVGYDTKNCTIGDKCPYYTKMDAFIENKILSILARDFPIHMTYPERIQYLKDSIDKVSVLLDMSLSISNKEVPK